MKETELLPAHAASAGELLKVPESGSALGRDPFAEDAGPDPFVERLQELELAWAVRGQTRPDPPRSVRKAPEPARRPTQDRQSSS